MRLLFLLALCLFVSTPRAEDAVDRYARQFIARERIPGLSLAVMHDGRLVKAAGYGVANLETGTPALAQTAYEIGSITKTFTAQAILLLVQDGRLELDAALSKILPDLPAAWRTLTIRQLLTHTSGLKDWEGEHLLDFAHAYSDAEYIDRMAGYPLDFAPGTQWSYSNTAYPLLGMVITRVSGEPYDAFIAKHIFAPLGMRDARFSRPQEIVPQRAGGYVDENGTLRKGVLTRPRIVEPNGGILANVLDLAKWQRAFRAGGLLGQASLEAMTQPVRLSDGSTFKSGLGIFVDEFRGHRLFVNNGSTPGGFSSVFYYYPDDRLSVIVLCNIDRGDAVNRLATHVAGSYVPGLAEKEL